jgi:beta-galactosidase/beta-glucuronidase
VIPADLGDRRVFIDLRAATYQPEVYIDGKLANVGERTDGWHATLIEITGAVKAGGKHSLVVRCHDRSVFFAPGFVLKPETKNEEALGKTLSPVGGYKDNVGIMDHVYMRITAKQYIDSDHLSVVTSTRKGTITVTGRVDGVAEGMKVGAVVLEGKGTSSVLTLGDVSVAADGTFTLTAAFPNAKHWSPESPTLYHLKLTLNKGGAAVDTHTQRFGFKEVWTEGPDFYLNGVKRRLLASSTWPLIVIIKLSAVDGARWATASISICSAFTHSTAMSSFAPLCRNPVYR